MTYPSSYTFNSSPTTYLGWFVGCTLGWVLLVSGISYLGERFNLIDQRYYTNFHFQLEKLARSPPIDTLFVGDSSLGAMLDSKAWSSLRGRPGIHLALTGSYGYAGSLNMVRRSLARLRPRNIVIMHTVDTMTRDIAYLGYLQTISDNMKIQDVPLSDRVIEQFKFYFSKNILQATLRGVWYAFRNRPDTYMDKDKEYIRLPNVIGAPDEIIPGKKIKFYRKQIKPKKLLFLKRLGELCHAQGLNCIYAHGPIYEGICQSSKSYIVAVGKLVVKSGIKLVPRTPICVAKTELSNTVDHVRQDLKRKYTKQYYDLLSPYLVQ